MSNQSDRLKRSSRKGAEQKVQEKQVRSKLYSTKIQKDKTKYKRNDKTNFPPGNNIEDFELDEYFRS